MADKAAPHASIHQHGIYHAAGVDCLLWPGNSPDLNAIEPTWAHFKWGYDQVYSSFYTPERQTILDLCLG